ncbi:MAG: hypothetical protein HN469_04975 [Candidatus Marinimicrobia bacterium]|nr:hypothetical protein [Candidatus Neomarinimicrobiota bacterium]
MKPIASKRFYFSMHERLFWSEAYQALPKSAVNLMMCFHAELRWNGKKKKQVFTNNGEISFSEAEFKANKLGASQTYINARNQLIRLGFIKVTYRGGMARGDMNKYKLLWVDGVFHHKMRWKRFPNENWEHEIPKVKDYAVGRETRFKKINNTLKNKTLNGTNPPKGLDPISVNPPNE